MLGWPLLHCCARKEGFSSLECVWETLPETPLIRAQCCSVRCSPRCWHKACADPLTVAQTSQRRKPRGHQYSPTVTKSDLLCCYWASIFCFSTCFSVMVQHSNVGPEQSRHVTLSTSFLPSISFYFHLLTSIFFTSYLRLFFDTVLNTQCSRCNIVQVPLLTCFQDVVCSFSLWWARLTTSKISQVYHPNPPTRISYEIQLQYQIVHFQ